MTVLLLLHLTLAFVFIFSAVSKLRDLHAFRVAVLDYRLLPVQLAPPFGQALPWLELLLGLMLLLGIGAWLAALGSILLLSSFIIAMGINLLRGRKDLNCGCGGARHSQKVSGRLIVRNLGLILLALPLVVWGQDNPVVVGWAWQSFSFALAWLILVDHGLPFTLALCGVLMLALLGQQLRCFIRMEAKA